MTKIFLFKQKLNWDNKKFIDTNFWLSLESHRVAYHPSISFSFCLFFCWTFCPCWTCWNWESWRLAISYRVPVGPNKTATRAFFKSPFWTVHSSISIPILILSLSLSIPTDILPCQGLFVSWDELNGEVSGCSTDTVAIDSLNSFVNLDGVGPIDNRPSTD